ncbi:MAG: hypothetical protein L3J52_08690 [Proteobacteria bacterium]|nr:hypothetical protein [Pseudomonadota bacterium]
MSNKKFDALLQAHSQRQKPDQQMMQNAKRKVKTYWLAAIKTQKRKKQRLLLFNIAVGFVILITIVLFLSQN